MSKQCKLSIDLEPYWLLETMACMNYVHTLDSDEWLNKSSSWSRRQKEEFLVPYRSYRGAMRARLQPIMEQYPLLMGYVDTTPRKPESLMSYEPPMMSFIRMMQPVLETEERPSEEELEKALNSSFESMLVTVGDVTPPARELPDDEGIVHELPCVKPGIHGLSDVMAALESWDGEDADKFKLLRLYSERREVMEQLWSLQGPCAEVGRSCLAMVRERFDACMEKLHQPEVVEALFSAVGLGYSGKGFGRATMLIMQYDRIVMTVAEDNIPNIPECTDAWFHVGIETFYLHEAKRNDIYNDDRLLERLKALGDPTRLKILHLLIERPCYLQEMAKELALTPATVLHHLGILMSEELIEVQMTNEKKKVYYQVKKQGLSEVSEGIMQLTLTRQEREARQRERQAQEIQQNQGGRQWKIQK